MGCALNHPSTQQSQLGPVELPLKRLVCRCVLADCCKGERECPSMGSGAIRLRSVRRSGVHTIIGFYNVAPHYCTQTHSTFVTRHRR